MGFFLGIDGGGTKTACLVGDEKSVLGSGAGGPSNILRVGEAEARKSLKDAIQQACDAAGINAKQVTRTCAGVAGGAAPEVAGKVRRMIGGMIPGEIEIAGDMVIAHHAAFGREAGIVIIAGTGSIAYGRNLAGETARAGGWGFAVSDEGSGYWIGRAAVRAALHDADRNSGPDNSLLRAIMKAWNVETREGLVMAANSSPTPDFAALFLAVQAEANSGDPVSVDVLKHAGIELSGLAKIIIARLFPDAKSIPVGMSGGVFRNSAVVREVFCNELMREFPTVAVRNEIVDPVEGALEMARRMEDRL